MFNITIELKQLETGPVHVVVNSKQGRQEAGIPCVPNFFQKILCSMPHIALLSNPAPFFCVYICHCVVKLEQGT